MKVLKGQKVPSLLDMERYSLETRIVSLVVIGRKIRVVGIIQVGWWN